MGSQVASIGKAPLVLGSSFFQQGPSYAALRCPFRPTSGSYGTGFYRQETESNAVTVQLPGTSAQFAGKLEPCKGSVDCVAIFDGKSWRLELLSAHINTRFVRGSNNGNHSSTPPLVTNESPSTQNVVLEPAVQSPEEAEDITGDDFPTQPVNAPTNAVQPNGKYGAQQQQPRPNSNLSKSNKEPTQSVAQAKKRTREPELVVDKSVDTKRSKPGVHAGPSSNNPARPVVQHNANATTRPAASTLQQQQQPQKQPAIPTLDDDDEDLDLMAVFDQEFGEPAGLQADASHQTQPEGALGNGIAHEPQGDDEDDDDDDMSSLIPISRSQPVQQHMKQPPTTIKNAQQDVSKPAVTHNSNGAAAPATANKPNTSRITAPVQPAQLSQNKTISASTASNQRPMSQPSKPAAKAAVAAPVNQKASQQPAPVQKPAVQKPASKPASAAAAWGFKGLDDDEDDDDEEEEEQPVVHQSRAAGTSNAAVPMQHNASRLQPAAVAHVADDDDEYDEDDDDAHLRCSDDEASDDLGLEDGLC